VNDSWPSAFTPFPRGKHGFTSYGAASQVGPVGSMRRGEHSLLRDDSFDSDPRCGILEP